MNSQNINIALACLVAVLCLPAVRAEDCSWKTESWMWFQGQTEPYQYFVNQKYEGEPLPEGVEQAQPSCTEVQVIDHVPQLDQQPDCPPEDPQEPEQPVEPPVEPPADGPSEPGNVPSDPATIPDSPTKIDGGYSGSGTTTRYWDCCKPTCGWKDKALLKNGQAALSCTATGQKLVDFGADSGCDPGDQGIAWTCMDNQPFFPDPNNQNLVYGFAAVNPSTMGGPGGYCCTCFRLTFTDPNMAEKEMIVQLTNDGNDVLEGAFDVLVPGGGMGQFHGCLTQFSKQGIQLGQDYGGFEDISQCDKNLPDSLKASCRWRFDWLGDNPDINFEQVTCPKELVAISGCTRT